MDQAAEAAQPAEQQAAASAAPAANASASGAATAPAAAAATQPAQPAAAKATNGALSAAAAAAAGPDAAAGGQTGQAQPPAPSPSPPAASPVLDDDELRAVEQAVEGDDDDDDDDLDVAAAVPIAISAASANGAASASAAAGSAAAAISPVAFRGDPAEQQKAKELHEARLARLASLREAQLERQQEEAESQRSARLQYLMEQADVFSHFVTKKDEAPAPKRRGRPPKKKPVEEAAAAEDAEAAAAKPGRKRRKSERQEDAELMAAAEEDGDVAGPHITQQPSLLSGGTLRNYQIEGLNWMAGLHENGINGILADEMGLGKTVQTIALLAYLREFKGIKGPHLVIAPKSTLGNWMKEFNKWCPTFNCLRLQAPKDERVRLVNEELMSGRYDVCITSYEVVIIEKKALRKFPWNYIVIDEAHRIKNEQSALAREVRHLHSAHRLLLTGTPLQNNLHELWALLNFLLPDVFSNAEDFDAWFDPKNRSMQDDVIKKLHVVLKPFLLRRKKTDVARELKPKIETKLYVGLTEKQREWYTKLLSKDISTLNSTGKGRGDRVRLLNILMQLRKCCNHPYLFDGAEEGPPFSDGPHLWENCGKMLLLHKLLPKLREQGSRVLLFSQMTRMLDIFEDYLRLLGFNYCRIDGNTIGTVREQAIDDFNAPDSDKFVFLLSTRAGGLGINLATADVVILYDSDWNPQMDLQAMDRAHRIGQKKQVRVFRFVTDGTVEEKIVERAERKLFLDALVIQQGRLMEKDKKLSKAELQTMVRFGADQIFKTKSATITDEDIDAILAKGEERTKASRARVKQDMQHSLSSFALEENKGDENIYLFGGKDYTEEGTKKAGAPVFIELPQRERKRNYDVDEYYRDVMQQSRRGRPQGQPRLNKLPPMADFQFFNRARIEELVGKSNELLLKRRDLEAQLKERRGQDGKARRSRMRKRAHALIAEGVDEREAFAQARRERLAEPADPALEEMQREVDALQLSAEEAKERDDLIAEGFSSWSKRDFRVFLTACEHQGRADRSAVIDEVSIGTEKSKEEVGRYFDTFWGSAPAAASGHDAGDADDDDDEEEEEEEGGGGDGGDDDDEMADAAGAQEEKGGERPGSKQKKQKKGAEAGSKAAAGAKAEKAAAAGAGGDGDDDDDAADGDEDMGQAAGAAVVGPRYRELDGWKKMLKKIARGEARLRRVAKIEREIEEKLRRHKTPYSSLHINYGGKVLRGYTPEEDRYLVCMMAELGYGEWEALQEEIRRAPQFRFDWFLKTRTTAELQRRCDTLVRLIEKENARRRGEPYVPAGPVPGRKPGHKGDDKKKKRKKKEKKGKKAEPEEGADEDGEQKQAKGGRTAGQKRGRPAKAMMTSQEKRARG